MLCKYKDIFGEPGKGIHKYRIFNIAIVDTLLTILAAWVISLLLHLNFFLVLIALFLLGIILHKLFCVDTTINCWIFGC